MAIFVAHAALGVFPQQEQVPHALAPSAPRVDLAAQCPSSNCFDVSSVPPSFGQVVLNGEKEAPFFPTTQPSSGNCWYRLTFMTTWGWTRTTTAWQGPAGSTFDTQLILTKNQSSGTPAALADTTSSADMASLHT